VTRKETNPPEPSTPDEYENVIVDNHHNVDYDEPPYEPEPETEPPIVKTPPPPRRNDRYERPYDGEGFGGRGEKPNKPLKPRINSEAEERTAMIIGIVAGALIAVILVILLVLWIKSNGDRSYKMEHDLKYGHGANAALLGHNAGGQHHANARHVGSGGSANAAGHHGNAHNGNQNMNQHHSNQPYQQQGNGYNQNSNYDVQDGGHNSPSMGLNGSLRHQQGGSGHYERNGMSSGLVQPKAKRNSKDIKEWYV
jgi:leucine-rich repeat transmembrane neuronal protein 1/2